MSAAVESRIASALVERLRQILVVNGYQTDAGERVYQGRVVDEELDVFPLISLAGLECDVSDASVDDRPRWVARVTIEGLVRDATDEPLQSAIALSSDMRRALFAPGRLLSDDVQRHTPSSLALLSPEPGSEIAAAVLTITVPYVENID